MSRISTAQGVDALRFWAREGSVTIKQAARLLRCRTQTVREVAVANNIAFPRSRAARELRLAEIRSAADSGDTMSLVAARLKCSVQNISKVAAKHQITFLRSGIGGPKPRKPAS